MVVNRWDFFPSEISQISARLWTFFELRLNGLGTSLLTIKWFKNEEIADFSPSLSFFFTALLIMSTWPWMAICVSYNQRGEIFCMCPMGIKNSAWYFFLKNKNIHEAWVGIWLYCVPWACGVRLLAKAQAWRLFSSLSHPKHPPSLALLMALGMQAGLPRYMQL